MTWSEKEEWRQRFLKVLAGFRLLDDDFMTAVFRSLACVDLLLQIILDKPQIRATEAIVQDTLKNLQGRSVRLDIHAWADGQEFDIEIQRGRGAAKRRARYNASLMDANALHVGEDYNELPESYVIFITEEDVLGEEQPLYIVRRTIEGSGRVFDDGSHILYVNSAMVDEDTPLGRLMHDFRCTRPEDMYYDVLAERVRYFKETEEGASAMCEAMEKLARDFAGELAKEAEARGMERGMERGMARGMERGMECGMERGREERNIAVVLGMLKEKLPLEMIARVSDISMDKIREIGRLHSLL